MKNLALLLLSGILHAQPAAEVRASPFEPALQDNPSVLTATAFNGDMVDQLELHEGAFPVRYEDRTAGGRDVHTRDGNRTGDTFRVANLTRMREDAKNVGIGTGPPDSPMCADEARPYLCYPCSSACIGG